MQVDSTAGSVTESLQARTAQNPEHALLLSEHRRLEKGRKELENQVRTKWHDRPRAMHSLPSHSQPASSNYTCSLRLHGAWHHVAQHHSALLFDIHCLRLNHHWHHAPTKSVSVGNTCPAQMLLFHPQRSKAQRNFTNFVSALKLFLRGEGILEKTSYLTRCYSVSLQHAW